MDYDVIVVGGGNAAFAAAVSARENGAKRVLLLEKAPREKRGGNTHFSGAVFRFIYDRNSEMDRFVPSAVKDLFKTELDLTDAQTSLPFSAFIVVYMLASPVFGALADRAPRKLLIAAGVAFWSAATAAAAFAHSFAT